MSASRHQQAALADALDALSRGRIRNDEAMLSAIVMETDDMRWLRLASKALRDAGDAQEIRK